MGFVNLHVHSYFSLLDGFNPPQKLIDRSLELNQPGIAITEHGNLFNALAALKYAKERNQKLIIGCEAYITPDRLIKTPDNPIFHILLLAKNIVGYRNLCKLISTAYKEGFYKHPRIDYKLLEEFKDGLICS